MQNSTLFKELIAAGYDAAFAKRAVTYIGIRFPFAFRKAMQVKQAVQFVKDNEYAIRHW